ncbi:MAG: hypothetical protein KBD16_04060 [Candidatus Pacebacteria bacterium]|nr:hypothetical protein [Candidatus Paceibacterota bacterium]
MSDNIDFQKILQQTQKSLSEKKQAAAAQERERAHKLAEDRDRGNQAVRKIIERLLQTIKSVSEHVCVQKSELEATPPFETWDILFGDFYQDCNEITDSEQIHYQISLKYGQGKFWIDVNDFTASDIEGRHNMWSANMETESETEQCLVLVVATLIACMREQVAWEPPLFMEQTERMRDNYY